MNSIITCGTVTEDSGKGVFTYAVDLTEYTGDVSLFYDTNFVPDRFIVEYNNNTVIDTGYVGDKEYDSKLAALGLTAVTGPGEGVATFNKGIPEITMVYITVYAPLPFSKWSFTFGCPADLLPNTPTPTSTITLTPTPSPTVTPTLTYLPNVVNCSTITQAGAGVYKYRILASNYVDGQIKISYNTYSVPDKFTLIHGTLTSTTGYVGDAMYSSDLITLGKEAVSGPGTGILTFQIEQNIDTILIVDAPLPNTAFDFSVICPTPTPTKTPTPTVTPSLSFTPTPDASPFVTPTRTPHGTPVATPPETPCPTTSQTTTRTPTGTPTGTPGGTPTGTPTGTPSRTPQATPTGTPTGTPQATPTGTPTGTPQACGSIVRGSRFSALFTSPAAMVFSTATVPLPWLGADYGRNCCGDGHERQWVVRADFNSAGAWTNGTISDTTNRVDPTSITGNTFSAGVQPKASGGYEWYTTYDHAEDQNVIIGCWSDLTPPLY